MANKIVNVYKFEYSMTESNWTAIVAAFSQEEAFKKLASMTNKRISKVTATQYVCRLDAISDELKKDILLGEKPAPAPAQKVDNKELAALKKTVKENATYIKKLEKELEAYEANEKDTTYTKKTK